MTEGIPVDFHPPCRANPELFFREGDASIAAAKAICAHCPFQAPCLDYSLRHSVQGVWAGTVDDERRKMRIRAGIRPVSIVTNPYPHRRRAAS